MPDNVLDIGEAAARLGVSADTLRKRLQRGKIQGFKGADGAWKVVFPAPGRQDSTPDNLQPRQDNSVQDRQDGLVLALKDEVAFLRSQLQVRDEEIRRAHVLLQQAQTARLAPPDRPIWWRRLFFNLRF